MQILKELGSPDEFLINAISKSSHTTETAANLEACVYELKKTFGEDALRRIVVSTDEGSPLWNSAQKHGVTLFSIPKNVGGRYSVFSAVGLFPLAVAGIDISMLLRGARMGQKNSLKESLEENHALAGAAIIHEHYKKGIKIHNTFLFDPSLESAGKWYRQLMGESIGKERDIEGNVVSAGITPTVSIGSTDLHSMAQLYLGGPKDKLTFFVKVLSHKKDAKIPDELMFSEQDAPIAGKTFDEIMDAIYGGVKSAYANSELPFAEVLLKELNEISMGFFLQVKMIEIMYLAKLLGINAFDQPNVEDYKKETKKLLAA